MTSTNGDSPQRTDDEASEDAARPDPSRAALARSMVKVSTLDAVAAAVSAATDFERVIYLERMPGGWRWSLAHRGGPYPLLRIVARFLRMDHTHLVVRCEGHESGFTITTPPGQPRAEALASKVVEFAGPTGVDDVRRLIVEALPVN